MASVRAAAAAGRTKRGGSGTATYTSEIIARQYKSDTATADALRLREGVAKADTSVTDCAASDRCSNVNEPLTLDPISEFEGPLFKYKLGGKCFCVSLIDLHIWIFGTPMPITESKLEEAKVKGASVLLLINRKDPLTGSGGELPFGTILRLAKAMIDYAKTEDAKSRGIAERTKETDEQDDELEALLAELREMGAQS
jgi:hypothetical protein